MRVKEVMKDDPEKGQRFNANLKNWQGWKGYSLSLSLSILINIIIVMHLVVGGPPEVQVFLPPEYLLIKINKLCCECVLVYKTSLLLT